jgi:hypothetical protein
MKSGMKAAEGTAVPGSAALSFQAERWFVGDHIKSAIVRLPKRFDDLSALSESEVIIDGVTYRCQRVRTAWHPPPYRCGECVALLVELPDD